MKFVPARAVAPTPAVRRVDRAAFYAALADDLARRVPGVRAEAMRAVFQLVGTYDALQNHLSPRIAERGLSMAGFNLLSILAPQPSGVAVNDLSDRLLVTRQNVSAVVDGLERKGFVRRGVDRGDRRVRRVTITAAGAALLDAILPEHLARVGQIVHELDAAELDQLTELLGRIRSATAASAVTQPPAETVASESSSGRRGRRRVSRGG